MLHQILRAAGPILATVFLLIGGSQFSLGQPADGTYKVINAHSGQSLALSGNGTANGTAVISYPYNGSAPGQWTLTSLGGGQYKLINVGSGRALEVAGNSNVAGSAMDTWDYSGASNQIFTLVSQPGGYGSNAGAQYYSIVAVHSGLAAQVSTTEPAMVNGNAVAPNASLKWSQKIVQNSYSATTLHAQWTFLAPTDGAEAGVNFSMVAIPDTQCESAGIRGSTIQNFYDKTDWVNSSRISKNIKYVASVGDIQQSFSTVPAQWQVAANAYYSLDDTVPYGVVPGNHDFGDGSSPADPAAIYETLEAYNTWFGPSHWAGKSYYGGNYADGLNNGAPSNGSHYDLISASGLDFIIVYMAWHGTESPVNWERRWGSIAWVNSVLQAHPDRRAIVVSHQLIGSEGQWSQIGLDLYNGIKTNSNLFLMLCGHVAPCKEATRRDIYNGNPVWTMLLDYQDGSPALNMGGSGILRHLTFKPKENLITSETYSPSTNQYYYRFSIPYRMHGEATPLSTEPAYYMLVNHYSGFVADLIGGNPAEGAVINQGTYDYNSFNQHWALVPTENMDHFKIVSRVTGKVLSVNGSSTANGAQIVDSTYVRNNPAQQWDLVDADSGNGWFNLRNVNSGLLLDHSGIGVNGGKIQQWASVPNNAKQRWRLQPVGNYYIRTSSGNYVSTQSGGIANGTNIVQQAGAPTSGFQWKFQSTGGGYLKVASLAAPNSVISVAGGSSAPGANVNLNTYDAANNGYQKVGIRPEPSGRTKFYFVNASLNLEVPGDSISPGTILQQNTNVPNATKQSFLLQRVP